MSAVRMTYSRCSAPISSTDAAASSLLAGITSPYSVRTMQSAAGTLFIIMSYVFGRVVFATPMPVLALPCGSPSTSSTRLPSVFSAAVRLTLVVVLPTPPFWFATAIIFAIWFLPAFLYIGHCCLL